MKVLRTEAGVETACLAARDEKELVTAVLNKSGRSLKVQVTLPFAARHRLLRVHPGAFPTKDALPLDNEATLSEETQTVELAMKPCELAVLRSAPASGEK